MKQTELRGFECFLCKGRGHYITAADGSDIACGGCKGTGRVHPPQHRLSPRATWPDLRITIHLLPWSWQLRPRFYIDDVDGWRGLCSFSWLMIAVDFYGNVPLFRETPAPTPGIVRERA